MLILYEQVCNVDILTKEYLKVKFRDYYKNGIEIPKKLKMREWAFVEIEALPNFIMKRHISFSDEDELKSFIINRVPLHIYYSSAYYSNPSSERMDEKRWNCADLIFDIDADHLPKKSLLEAKRRVIRLYDILTSEFGCEDVDIFFSGHRGYHIHVYDDEFLKLNSQERREIVDYLNLSDFNFSEKLPFSRQSERILKCMARAIKKAKNDGLRDLFPEMRKRSVERMNSMIDELITSMIRNYSFSNFPKKAEDGLKRIFYKCRDALKIYVDAPVTADVRRLIRAPGSLHGKTGLRVCKISRDEINEFSPMRDAVVFGDEKVKIRVMRKVKVKMKDEVYKLNSGKAKVPEYLAIYLMCKGICLYGW